MLNEEQLQAVNFHKGTMMVLAGPGSGKTRVLTERIRVLIEKYKVSPDEILVITFSKKAAKEMQNRFISLTGNKNYPVNFGTFHSVFFAIIRFYYHYSTDSILTDKEKCRILESIGKRLGIEKATYLSWQEEMISYISMYKNHGEEMFKFNLPGLSILEEIDLFRMVYDEYNRLNREESKIDYDDMILICYQLLYKHESVLKLVKERYKYILVDEFQDINLLQYKILRLIAGDDKNLFCVGDDDQSIYEFRGANPEIMKHFFKHFPMCKMVYLSTNYRCPGKVVDCADRLINNNQLRIARCKQKVIEKMGDGCVEVINTVSSLEQGEKITQIIKELTDNGSFKYNEIAILFRSIHCVKMLESSFAKYNIPINIKNSEFDLFKDKELKIILSYMKIAVNKGNKSDFLLVLNNPARNLSREAIHTSDDIFDGLRQYYSGETDKMECINRLEESLSFIKELTPFAAYVYILHGIGLKDYFAEKNIKSEININDKYCIFEDILREFETIDSFVDQINNYPVQNCNRQEKQGVNFMTAHASKGLEFKIVFIIGLQEGLFPHNKNLHGKAVEEERRLMYVAMTRAKEQLYLCTISNTHGKQVSRFIAEALN